MCIAQYPPLVTLSPFARCSLLPAMTLGTHCCARGLSSLTRSEPVAIVRPDPKRPQGSEGLRSPGKESRKEAQASVVGADPERGISQSTDQLGCFGINL